MKKSKVELNFNVPAVVVVGLDKFQVTEQIACPSACTLVHKGLDRFQKPVAIKLEHKSIKGGQLFNDADVISRLCEFSESVGLIPRFVCRGAESTREFNVLVTELLGSDLERHLDGNMFSEKDLHNFMKRSLHILKFIHHAGYLHSDLKPANFLFPLGKEGDISALQILDFGCSKPYLKNGEHIMQKQAVEGTISFISPYVHQKDLISRRDDLISLGYVAVFLCTWKLPWLKQSRKKIGEAKVKMTSQQIAQETNLSVGVKDAWCSYMDKVLNMAVDEEPDYDELLRLFVAASSSAPSPSKSIPHVSVKSTPKKVATVTETKEKGAALKKPKETALKEKKKRGRPRAEEKEKESQPQLKRRTRQAKSTQKMPKKTLIEEEEEEEEEEVKEKEVNVPKTTAAESSKTPFDVEEKVRKFRKFIRNTSEAPRPVATPTSSVLVETIEINHNEQETENGAENSRVEEKEVFFEAEHTPDEVPQKSSIGFVENAPLLESPLNRSPVKVVLSSTSRRRTILQDFIQAQAPSTPHSRKRPREDQPLSLGAAVLPASALVQDPQSQQDFADDSPHEQANALAEDSVEHSRKKRRVSMDALRYSATFLAGGVLGSTLASTAVLGSYLPDLGVLTLNALDVIKSFFL